MGMNIQKSAGVKADTFILKRNNMDRRIRMDVAMLIILWRRWMLIQDPVKDSAKQYRKVMAWIW